MKQIEFRGRKLKCKWSPKIVKKLKENFPNLNFEKECFHIIKEEVEREIGQLTKEEEDQIWNMIRKS